MRSTPRSFPFQVLLVACLVVGALAGGMAGAAGTGHRVEAVSDLQADARRSREAGVPILLVVSQHHCPFCKLLREEILEPMLLSGDYASRVIVRELFLDGDQALRDFDGKEIGPDDLAERYGAFLTPTLLFLDHRGRELTERMLGINTVDFYGYYLDASIKAARSRLQALYGTVPALRAVDRS